MALIDNVLKISRQQNMEAAELERRANLAKNSIYKWRDHFPSIDKVQRVAQVLDVPVDALLK